HGVLLVFRGAFVGAVVVAALGIALTSGAARSSTDAGRSRWVSTRLSGFCRSCGVDASALNDRGVVVGSSGINDDPEGVFHGALWEGGKVRDLGTLGGAVSAALDVNDQGEVVGWSYRRGGHIQHGFLWENGRSRMRDLGTLRRLPAAWGGSMALAINDHGQV